MKPWRTVVHIKAWTGTRGAEFWALKLDCGHTEDRRQPAQLGLRAIVGKGRLPPLTAPSRVRCLMCEISGPLVAIDARAGRAR